jgi:parallel beta-helix repeat protein
MTAIVLSGQPSGATRAAWIDTLIERNHATRCERGVELQMNSKGTVVRNNTFFDIGEPLLDNGEATLWRDNREEYPEP